MRPYERFEAWRLCHELALSVYRDTRRFPRSELYGLTSQLRRAAVSAVVNIVEGSAKLGRREFRRFLDISLGSLAEVGYILLLAKELELIDSDVWEGLDRLQNRASVMTWRLYRSLGPRPPTASVRP